MKILFLVACFLFSALCYTCRETEGQTLPVQGSSTFSCSERVYFNPGNSLTWRVKMPNARCNVGLSLTSEISGECVLSLQAGGKSIFSANRLSPKSFNYYFYSLPGESKDVILQGVNAQGNQCIISQTMTLSYSCAPSSLLNKTDIILSGLTLTDIKRAPVGGFNYVALPPEAFRAGFVSHVTWEVEIYSYTGLKPPTCLVSTSDFPTLESYEYSNETLKEDGKYKLFLTIPVSPNYSPYTNILGIYLYGTASKFAITPTVYYTIPSLSPDMVHTFIVNSTYYRVFNITIPRTFQRKSFVLQYAREIPGGNSTISIGYGVVPLDVENPVRVDPRVSYGTITIPNTNFRIGNDEMWTANPGTIIVLLKSLTPNAGLLVQWTFSGTTNNALKSKKLVSLSSNKKDSSSLSDASSRDTIEII